MASWRFKSTLTSTKMNFLQVQGLLIIFQLIPFTHTLFSGKHLSITYVKVYLGMCWVYKVLIALTKISKWVMQLFGLFSHEVGICIIDKLYFCLPWLREISKSIIYSSIFLYYFYYSSCSIFWLNHKHAPKFKKKKKKKKKKASTKISFTTVSR